MRQHRSRPSPHSPYRVADAAPDGQDDGATHFRGEPMFWIILLLAVHLLAAVFWVGGMAFAYTMLRPAAGALDPPVRLPLWRRVFTGFFPWVGLSIVVLLVSGFAMIFLLFGSFADAPPYVHAMMGVGILMMLLYLHLIFAPWRRFRAALD